MSETLINIQADSAEEFMEKVSQALGEGDGVMGDTQYHVSFKFSGSADKISKVAFVLTVDIKRAHWAGGKSDEKNKKAIQAAEQKNKDHEQKHKKLAEDICKREFAKAAKAVEGKTKDDAQDALDAIKKQIDDAYDKLDAAEGMTDVTPNSDGTFTVKQVGR
jgi:hypothetical protein